jgi:hypothetical protein
VGEPRDYPIQLGMGIFARVKISKAGSRQDLTRVAYERASLVFEVERSAASPTELEV